VNSQGVLENGAGNVVLGQAGNPITIPSGFDVTITKEGDIYARDLNQPGVQPSVLIDRLMLRDSSRMTFERREDALMRPQPEFRNRTVILLTVLYPSLSHHKHSRAVMSIQ